MSEDKNPYKYLGPLNLDPNTKKNDRIICIERKDDVNLVIGGARKSQYWAILGPRQIGKTTFLRQIRNKFTDAHCIYFDFQSPPSDDENLYQMLIDRLLNEIPGGQASGIDPQTKGYSLALRFVSFLEHFHFQDEGNKKVIFLFDEVDSLPSLKNFLSIWRSIFSKRADKQELNRYAVIIAGSVDLIKITIGPNSPFNIAQVLYLKDFLKEESEELIDLRFPESNIDLEARKMLLDQISGHPQMLQHACSILADKISDLKKDIELNDVTETIDRLYKDNLCLSKLKSDLETNEDLRYLIKGILRGAKRKFNLYKEWSLSGAGAIKEENSFCAIRNKIYKNFIIDFFEKEADGEIEIELTLETAAINEKEVNGGDSSGKVWINYTFWTSFALAIIFGFISILTNFPGGMILAGISGFLAFILLFFVRFSDENDERGDN